MCLSVTTLQFCARGVGEETGKCCHFVLKTNNASSENANGPRRYDLLSSHLCYFQRVPGVLIFLKTCKKSFCFGSIGILFWPSCLLKNHPKLSGVPGHTRLISQEDWVQFPVELVEKSSCVQKRNAAFFIE